MSSKFGLSAIKNHPAIAPLCIIMAVATAGVTFFSVYSLFKKTDVTLIRSKGSRWDQIDVNKPQKFLTINQAYGEDPAVTSLKKELAEAYINK